MTWESPVRLRTGFVLLAVLAGCSGTRNSDHDAGEPPHWSAGIYTTDYPNGMRTWLRVVAPDRVEQVALADTVLAMERSDAGTVWARVPRDQPEGLTELVLRGEAGAQGDPRRNGEIGRAAMLRGLGMCGGALRDRLRGLSQQK